MTTLTAAPRAIPILSENPAKREMERFVLLFSPVWMTAVGVVMATRALAHWGELEHLLLGLGLALPIWLGPIVRPLPSERSTPILRRHSTRFNVAIAIFTVVQTWIGSNLFFDQLGMEYHFNTTVTLNRTPVFLFLMTIAYFSSYYTVMTIVFRAIASRVRLGPVARFAVLCVLGYVVAFAETWSMASDILKDWFFYRDQQFALLVGSIGYGLLFVITLPLFLSLDESADTPPRTLRSVAVDALALNTVALMAYEVFAWVLGKR